MSNEKRARELLRRALGETADFHPGQLEAILALVDDRARVLVVQRTGWGKSVVYFLATALLREGGSGPTILISPLLSLMRDQMRMAARLGVEAESVNSTNPGAWGDIEGALKADQLDILLVSPERLANDHFRTTTLGSIPKALGLLVVDEAHCISDWGHDFRPDYRRIRSLVDALPSTVPLLATTATANNRVIEDVTEQLGSDLLVIRGPLDRESLHLQAITLDSQAERLAWLSHYIPTQEGSGIIYVLTRGDAQRVSDWLAERGIDAPVYSSAQSDDERRGLEQRLLDDDVKALVATVALGMGFDKPDLSFVVHFQRPPSPIAYYQQIGRAGRALPRAEAILLAGKEDDAIAGHFIVSAFAPEHELRELLAVLDDLTDASESELGQMLNLKPSALKRDLKMLEVDGAISRDHGRYARTPLPWSPDPARIEAVTSVRQHEGQRMRELVTTDACLMEFLRGELDDPDAEPCGRCANCAGAFAPTVVDPVELRLASSFLHRLYREISPRKQWPVGIPDRPRNIPPEQRLQEGRALCLYGDTGWGQLAKTGKYGGAGFDEQLVQGVAEMLENYWQPDVAPTWVAAVPSRRAPELVSGFAQRLASRLGLPYREALVKIADTPQQKTMQNSYHQARNALRSFAANADNVIAEPVYLVDDMVDSRWSLAVCAVLLSEAGSGPVVPLAVAETTSGSSD